MKIILSQPFCGSLYWWFGHEEWASGSGSKTPAHPYYAALYGDVDAHFDIALACSLIFDQVIIPAADVPFPDAGRRNRVSMDDLGFEADWDVIFEAQRVLGDVSEIVASDEDVRDALTGLSEDAQRLELHYAIADVLLAREHQAPVLCSTGRHNLVKQLVELGVIPVDTKVAALLDSRTRTADVIGGYVALAGLTFGADDVRAFADLKWKESLRRYARSFQRVLTSPTLDSVEQLHEAILDAWSSADLTHQITGAFKATSKSMDILGLLPGVGTAAGLIGLGADAAGTAAAKRGTALRWYELAAEVARVKSLRDLEISLRRP